MLDMSAAESLPEQQTALCQLNISVLIKLTLPRGEKKNNSPFKYTSVLIRKGQGGKIFYITKET